MAVVDTRNRWRGRRGPRRRRQPRIGLILGAGLVMVAAIHSTPAGGRWFEAANAWLATRGVSTAEAPAGEAFDTPVSHGQLAGRPTRITDGDTFRLGGARVRLSGIDAPEMSTREGPIAQAELARIVGGGQVRCEDSGERSYDRIVATCYGPDGQDLAAAMVRNGWARDWPRYSHGRYDAMQREAERAGRGMHART